MYLQSWFSWTNHSTQQLFWSKQVQRLKWDFWDLVYINRLWYWLLVKSAPFCVIKGYLLNKFLFLWKNFLHFRVWNVNSKMLKVLELNLLIILNIFKCQIIDHYMKIMHSEAFIRNHNQQKIEICWITLYKFAKQL